MKKHKFIVVTFLCLYLLGISINWAYAAKNSNKNPKNKKSQNIESLEEEDSSKNLLGKYVISKSPYIGAIAIDAASGRVLFEDNADAKGFPASIIKIMNLFVILDAVKDKIISLEDKVTIKGEVSKIGGSQVFLKEKEVFTVNELLYALIVQSANDAALALALHLAGSKEAFVDLMNQKAMELGMKNTQFHSVHGLPPGKDQLPDVSTARDIAILSNELLKYSEVLEYTSVKERAFRPESKQPFIMRNHNNLLRDLEGCDGLKTGYFFNGGFSVAATAAKKGQRVIAVVMGSVNRKVRDSSAKEIISKGLMELIRTAPKKSEIPVIKKAPEKNESPTETVSDKTRTAAAGEEEGYYTIRISKTILKVLGGIFVGVILLIIAFSIGRKKRII